MRWKTLLLLSLGLACSIMSQATTTFNITPETKMVGENLTAKVEY
jgi:hypothetical protein